MDLLGTHDYESAIRRPCYARQSPKISSITVYQPGGLTVNLGNVNIRGIHTVLPRRRLLVSNLLPKWPRRT